MNSQELFFVFRLKKIIEYMRMCNVEIQKGQEKVQIKKRLCPSSIYYTIWWEQTAFKRPKLQRFDIRMNNKRLKA